MKFIIRLIRFIFLILIMFSNLNSLCISGKDTPYLGSLELFPSGGFYVCELPTLAL
jgi:hypothetical protein